MLQLAVLGPWTDAWRCLLKLPSSRRHPTAIDECCGTNAYVDQSGRRSGLAGGSYFRNRTRHPCSRRGASVSGSTPVPCSSRHMMMNKAQGFVLGYPPHATMLRIEPKQGTQA